MCGLNLDDKRYHITQSDKTRQPSGYDWQSDITTNFFPQVLPFSDKGHVSAKYDIEHCP